MKRLKTEGLSQRLGLFHNEKRLKAYESMRHIYDRLVQHLISEFNKLPSIGTRTAERLAYFVLNRSKQDNLSLCRAITDVNEKVIRCELCNNFTEVSPCDICKDQRRDQTVMCVVEEPHDLVAIEKTGKFNGVYHVLMGVLSPLDGIGPENLQMNGLISRLKKNAIKEVILATNTTAEGETTALYLCNFIRKAFPKILISRIAYGLAVGADLEFIDSSTIAKSLEGRHAFQ